MEMLSRGVYLAPYRVHGHRVLVAIDSAGEARKHLKLDRLMPEQMAWSWMRQMLDVRWDPPTELTLIRAKPTPEPRADPVRAIPLASYLDPYETIDTHSA